MIPDEDPIPPPDPPEEDPVEEIAEEPLAPMPEQLLRDGRIPVDTATGEEYKSGEVPLGWNQPLP